MGDEFDVCCTCWKLLPKADMIRAEASEIYQCRECYEGGIAEMEEVVTTLEPCLSPSQTRHLLAVLVLLQRDGRATMQDVCDLIGAKSKNGVFEQLRRLRKLGFVTWHDHCGGTLRSPWRLWRV